MLHLLQQFLDTIFKLLACHVYHFILHLSLPMILKTIEYIFYLFGHLSVHAMWFISIKMVHHVFEIALKRVFLVVLVVVVFF